ncbi:UvrABC system protein C [Capsulimonas corticalis]|uniref:UvrABC system protein C n=1 Tax=Capsulimonas corticalis TaxID=2219043 RepID=A0A402CQU8_9BACT|nr:excinuclease ABC subunit UvrC [Capsulimonas corticalis]BDI34480.1 UvrABC system protein C [Capsulimonas corticalis]
MVARIPSLEEKLKGLPTQPGCYLYKDAAGEIIYVGKAINLRNRVRSYFQKSAKHSPKTRKLISRTVDLDYIVVDSELEALILECNLIKEHRPHYNIRLRDDKQYPYLVLTMNEPYPRLLVTRRVKKDGAKYFGPFTNSRAVWDSLRLIYRLFPLVTCRKRWDNSPVQRPCLYHHMGRCPHAPCAGLANSEEYRKMVDDVAMFLDGKQEKLVQQLRAEMEEASEDLQFERAARLRDQIAAVETLIERQKVVSTNAADQDVVAIVNDHGESAVQMFFIRNGKLIGQEHFMLEGLEDEEGVENATGEFLKQYYQDAAYVPTEIILPTHVEETVIIEQWLRQKKGTKVTLTVPERGGKKQLLDMAIGNAKLALEQMRTNTLTEYDRTMGALMELQDALGIDTPLERIEAYDISTIQGSFSVGGMVVFKEGKPAKSEYRRFKIQKPTNTGEPNDFAMMREVLTRRLKEAKSGNPKFSTLPDLMLIDGGKGQLGVAVSVAKELDVELNMIGLAKQFELVYQPGQAQPLALPKNSQALFLLQRIRDEVHRYSVTYHRTLRGKNATLSVLDTIPGIGLTRRRELLKFFGSVERMKNASVDQLAAAPAMNKRLAATIHKMLHGNAA